MTKKKSKSPTKNVMSRSQPVPVMANDMWKPFNRLRNEFDRMFDDIPDNTIGSRLWQRLQESADPAVELREMKDRYDLVAEVPGMASDEIEIKLSDGMLRLCGEKSESHEEEGESFMFSERHYGSFERAIKLPSGIDSQKISAEAKDGLLTVHIPKSAEAIEQERKIPITKA